MNENCKLFIRFLKDNNIYITFQQNLWNEQEILLIKYMIDNKRLYKSYISYAFTWHQTKEGNDFWYSINSKWLKTFNEYKFDRFVKFLIDNNAYDTFTSKIKKLKPYMEKINENHLITRRLNWKETKEGEKFWSNINIKWLKLLDNENG